MKAGQEEGPTLSNAADRVKIEGHHTALELSYRGTVMVTLRHVSRQKSMSCISNE